MAFPDGWLHIRNWEKYQHYHNRGSMNWVKLHTCLLGDPEFLSLPVPQRYAWICLLLLAASSSHPGHIPLDLPSTGTRRSQNGCTTLAERLQNGSRTLARRMSLGRQSLALDLLISKGLIENSASTVLAQKEEKEDINKEKEKKEKKPRRVRRFDPSPEFLKFYEAYPKKIAPAKAWKAWQEAGINGDFQKVIDSVEDHKTWKQWEDPQFIPYPATFLNQGRWLDEKPARKSPDLDESELAELRRKAEEWDGRI